VVAVADADALVWTDPADSAALRAALEENPAISWVQLPWAGIEPLVGVLDADRLWTSGKGVYAEEVAEHALALALAGMRHLAAYARANGWSGPAGVNLLGAKVTMLGAGGIAESFARLVEPFGVELRVVRRTAEPFPGAQITLTPDALDDLLDDTDLLVVALALTPETTGIIDAARLARLPAHAWIVNVGRGRHIVTDDLIDALRRGAIGGAALDVTDPEPLPDDHPLWALDNCLITPHVANTPEMAVPVLTRRITENVRRRIAGEPLLGVVDVEAGY
jgi:phosphoglycerate dehydrogenase-like enzyme